MEAPKHSTNVTLPPDLTPHGTIATHRASSRPSCRCAVAAKETGRTHMETKVPGITLLKTPTKFPS
eukprot:9617081-Prorocentrum_lima.AAC.1